MPRFIVFLDNLEPWAYFKSISNLGGFSNCQVEGCFDILHVGHVEFLKEARSFGDYLIVLLESDENIKKLKGKGKPIFSLKERITVLKAIKYVDEKLPAYAGSFF